MVVIQPLSTRLIKPNFCFHPTLCKDLATSPAEKESKWAKTLRLTYLGSLERVFLSLYASDFLKTKFCRLSYYRYWWYYSCYSPEVLILELRWYAPLRSLHNKYMCSRSRFFSAKHTQGVPRLWWIPYYFMYKSDGVTCQVYEVNCTQVQL